MDLRLFYPFGKADCILKGCSHIARSPILCKALVKNGDSVLSSRRIKDTIACDKP